jgi:hypothetical protein
MKRGYLYSAVALALLLADFAFFPVLWKNRINAERVSLADIARGEVVAAGRYHLHPIRLSAGRIDDAAYLPRLGTGTDAVAITAYSASADNPIGIGGLGSTVLAALTAKDATALTELLSHTASFSPGRVQALRLEKVQTEGPLRGIKTVLVLRAVAGDGSDAKAALRAGLVELLRQATRNHVSGLLLPTLAVSPARRTPTIDEFFGDLFDALPQSPDTVAIDLTLWDQLPTKQLQEAVAAFNAHWTNSSSAVDGGLSNIYRLQVRLILIGLCIGLLSSARAIALTPRSALIVATSLALYLLGTFKGVEELAVGLDEETLDALLVVLTILLSASYPRVALWSAQDLFKDQRHAA